MADIEHSDVCPHPRGECECGGFVAASDLADAIQRRDDCEQEVTALRDQLWGAVEAIRKAPHANHCDARSPMWPGPCTCWKRQWMNSPTATGGQ